MPPERVGGGVSTCWCAAAKGRGRRNGWCDRRSEVSTAVARRRGNAAATQAACQRQRQLGLHLLLDDLVLSPRSLRHEPGTTTQPSFSRLLLSLQPSTRLQKPSPLRESFCCWGKTGSLCWTVKSLANFTRKM